MEYIITILKGAALALITIGISLYIPEDIFYPFFALLLTFAAGVYAGFAIVDKDHYQEYKLQVLFSLIFIALAVLGIWKLPLLIAVGWAIHGLWDLLHHLRQLKTETGRSYPLFCLSYDFIVAWYIYYVWVLTLD